MRPAVQSAVRISSFHARGANATQQLGRALQALLDQPVETFPSCGHLPHIDQPRKVAERCHALLTHG